MSAAPATLSGEYVLRLSNDPKQVLTLIHGVSITGYPLIAYTDHRSVLDERFQAVPVNGGYLLKDVVGGHCVDAGVSSVVLGTCSASKPGGELMTIAPFLGSPGGNAVLASLPPQMSERLTVGAHRQANQVEEEAAGDEDAMHLSKEPPSWPMRPQRPFPMTLHLNASMPMRKKRKPN